MKQFAFPLGDQPELTIHSHADLRMTGWERPEASVDSAPGYSLKIEQTQTGLRVTCLDDCEIFIPTSTRVTIEKVSGDLRVANLGGSLTIEKVSGSVLFTQIASASIGKIAGDCQVSGVTGAFIVGKISGSLDGSQFGGDVNIEKVGGDLRADGIAAGFTARAGGSIQAQVCDGFGPVLQLRASGDVHLSLPVEDHGHYLLTSSGEEIRVDLQGMKQNLANKVHEFSRGERAGREVELRAGGAILLTDQPLEAASSSGMPAGVPGGSERAGRWPEISRTTEEAISRAARSAEDALRQAERRVTDALRGLEGRWVSPRSESVPPAGVVETGAEEVTTAPEITLDDRAVVSDQERLLILKMLQEKKITVDEAEALLEALGNPG